jgi:hypothetical protein
VPDVSNETLHVTASQIEAAKLLIRMLEADGEPVDDDLRAIADAEPSGPAGDEPSPAPGLAVYRAVQSAMRVQDVLHQGSFAAFTKLRPLLLPGVGDPVTPDQLTLDVGEAPGAVPWEALDVDWLASRYSPGVTVLPGEFTDVLVAPIAVPQTSAYVSHLLVATSGERSLDVANELLRALDGQIPPDQLSDEARKELVVIDDESGKPKVVGLRVSGAAAKALHDLLLERDTAREQRHPSDR